MEFDAKKSRQQRIKRDRRADKRQPAGTESKNANVTKQEKIKDQNGSNADNASKKPVDVTDVDPNFYARLKRETDDIAALKSKKPVNRQVFSSWSKLEQPIPDVEEYNQLPDFETLLCSAQGGHFRFKAEKLWDVGLTPGLYSELFTANIDLLAAGINCVPFYKRLDLDSCLFNEEEIEKMHTSAKHNLQHYEKEKQRKKNNPEIVNNVVPFLEINSVENESSNTAQLNFKIDGSTTENLEESDMKFFKPENFKRTQKNVEERLENENFKNLVDKSDSQNSNLGSKSKRPDSSVSQTLDNHKSSASNVVQDSQNSNLESKSKRPDGSFSQALDSRESSAANVVQESWNNAVSKSIINEPKEVNANNKSNINAPKVDISVIQKISVENDNIDKSNVSSKANDDNLTVILPEPTCTYNVKEECSNVENQSKNKHGTGNRLPVTCTDKLESEVDSRISNNNFATQNSMKSAKIKKNISNPGDKDNLDSLLTLKGKKTMEKCELESIISKTGDSASPPQDDIEEDEIKDHLPPVIATAKKEDLEDWLDAMLDD